ncbi:MAG TPA: hypothetical protein VJS44_08425 [Pyrinomonadaceae bacterium]|nr:hypothetical protein [Pyrinomonadaceae bacterium]
MRPPSENALVSGTDVVRAFRGVTVLGGKSGSRLLFNADQSYAGLGTQAVNGTGSAFVVKQLLMAIGAGQVNFDGAAISSFIASSTLSFIKKSGGVYAAGASTGPFQAGHAQPSAPLIFAKDSPSAGKEAMTGAVTVVIWRVSSITGQVSLMSLPSNVLELSNQSVIVQMPAADSNGQTHWGIGVVKLGYADLGFYIQLPTSLGGEVSEADLTTIDGITRAVEISWSNGALQGQPLAPDKAFPLPAGQFAGVMNDTLFLDADGIIYVGEPGYIGSFPPSNAIFASEPAVHWLKIGPNAFGRFGKHSVGILMYVGGSPALEYQEILSNQGIALPQNVALGFGGRLLMWLGKPTVLDKALEPDFEYANKVMPDFDGWDAGQSTSQPIVPCFDPQGLYECWCFQKKVMAKHAPTGRWCAPIDLTGKINGNIVSHVIHDRKLYLSCVDGLTLKLYQFDAGTGSTMVVQTDDTAPGRGDTISEVFVQARTDDEANNLLIEAITNHEDDSPAEVFDDTVEADKTLFIRTDEPNIIDAVSHALRVTVPCLGGDASVELIESYGARSF